MPLIWVQSRGNRDGRPILPLTELRDMGYRGVIDAQIMLGVAVHFMKQALAELVATGNYTGITDEAFVGVRKEIEDLIGLDAYYRIEAETVEPGSRPRSIPAFRLRHSVLSFVSIERLPGPLSARRSHRQVREHIR